VVGNIGESILPNILVEKILVDTANSNPFFWFWLGNEEGTHLRFLSGQQLVLSLLLAASILHD